MISDLLVIFENEQVFPDALHYAREFVLRIDARITRLMICPLHAGHLEKNIGWGG